MQSADYWHLCDGLSIFQAIMLILGYDPENRKSYEIEQSRSCSIPQGYAALKTAIINAVKMGTISSDIVGTYDYDGNLSDSCVDIDETIVEVSSLVTYLKSKGIKEGFFFPEGNIFEEYLDPNHSYFAPKLAAAIQAWKVVTNDPKLQRGKTPKQALEKWLRENGSKFGLTKEDGSPNETGIQEICKIANWKPEGGASKTPTHSIDQDNSPTPLSSPLKLKVFGITPSQIDDFEDQIPF